MEIITMSKALIRSDSKQIKGFKDFRDSIVKNSKKGLLISEHQDFLDKVERVNRLEEKIKSCICQYCINCVSEHSDKFHKFKKDYLKGNDTERVEHTMLYGVPPILHDKYKQYIEEWKAQISDTYMEYERINKSVIYL